MEIGKDIIFAAECLKKDRLVAIPTETVYGLAGNAFSETAVRKIFETKNRPLHNPLIVHISSVEFLHRIASEVPEKAKQLADAFWPGSLTMVLPKHDDIPDIVSAGKPTVGVRIPNHEMTYKLLQSLPFPLAAPSANPFGYISPTQPRHVQKILGRQIAYTLDGGECDKGLESTIIGFESGEPVLYRHGAIPKEEIEKVVGPINEITKSESSPNAPGMLLQHYSPATDFVLVDDLPSVLQNYENKRIGLLVLKAEDSWKEKHKVIELSPNHQLEEAAQRLFNAMHQLDELNLDLIIAERLPNIGLGRAINDRLERAASE